MPEFRLKPYQDDFIFSDARFPAIVASVGTGKSLCLILRMMRLMEESENNLGIIIRKEFTDLRDSTLKDFELYTGLKVDANKEVKLKNGSLIMFRHGDEINVLKNINAGAIGIEQAEEFDSDEQFQFLRDRLRRKEAKTRSLFLCANTNGHNWIWKLWKNNPASTDYRVFEATTFDNKDNLPEDYVRDLQSMEAESPHHYARYVLNSWDDLEEQDNLIPYEYVRLSYGLNYVPQGGKVLAVDVARFGDDETVFTLIQDCDNGCWKQIFQQAYKHKDLMQTVGRIIDLKREYEPTTVVVDDDGLGGGVSDRLLEEGHSVVKFHAAEKAFRDEFLNRRIESYWKVRELMRQRKLELVLDDELHQQLSGLKYRYKSNGRKFLESKEDAKKRGLKSPDRSDALMMAVSVISMVPEIVKEKTQAESFWEMVKRDQERLRQERQELDEGIRTLN